jgi:hypothetical protein
VVSATPVHRRYPAARDLGYIPAATYANAVPALCDWLVETVREGDWRERFPTFARYGRDLFDYAAEDEFLGATQMSQLKL